MLKDPSHVPSTGKSWSGTLPNGDPFRIPWDSVRQPYGSFYSQVVRFHTDNNLPIPSDAEVQAKICSQLPKHWCVNGGENYVPPAPARIPCPGCGGRSGRGFR